jgi:hypothetical protein
MKAAVPCISVRAAGVGGCSSDAPHCVIGGTDVSDVNELADLILCTFRPFWKFLDPMSQARVIGAFAVRGVTQERMANALGIARSSLANTVRLLRLNEDLQKKVENGDLSLSGALPLTNIADDRRLSTRLAEEYVAGIIGSRDLEGQLCQHRKRVDTPKPPRRRGKRWPEMRRRETGV